MFLCIRTKIVRLELLYSNLFGSLTALCSQFVYDSNISEYFDGLKTLSLQHVNK